MILADAARLSITTDNGRVDPAAPFRAFNGRSSRIEIDHPLLHEGPFSRIVIAIDWVNFPAGGLGRYYRGYDLAPPIHTARFVATVAAPLSGWTAGKRRLRLFRTGGISRFDLAATGRRLAGQMPVTLTLDAPAYGFGDTAYSNAVMAAALQAASGGRARMPNPPWAPMAASVMLSLVPA